ncbi:unnamed protein product [Paramecium primaurelia]|uniref:VLIG-type G domain-containing protein n=1 Tax=Paramecium primaurelia TaxID=5886 RepID=A0A8S1KHU6_PARPR|nr:unnamed protein product [Paramecium primaurelia]
MYSPNESIQITLLYSIVTDYAQEFQLDKINFHYKNIQQISNDLNDSQKVKIKGLFGCQKNIEREIYNEFKKEVDLTEFLKQSDKGNLIIVQFQNEMVFSLILPIKFFTKKPILEKSIEIVLLRILHDFADNIQLCLDETVFADWYSGDIVPFSAQLLERYDYDFAEVSNQEIQMYQCQYYQRDYDISKCQIIKSQSLLPQVYIVDSLEMNKIEQLLNTYNEFTEALMIQIITKQNPSIIPLINSFKKEHQNDKLKGLLNDFSKKLYNEIMQQRQILTQKIFKNLQQWYNCVYQQDKKYQQESEQIVNTILQTVKLNQQKHPLFQFNLTQDHKKHNEIIQFHLDIIYKKSKEIQSQFQNQIKQLFSELCQLTKYSVKKINLKIYRKNENITERILNIWPYFDEDQNFCLDGSFLKNQTLNFEIKEIFSTKKKATIFIVYTQTTAYILFLQFQASQVKVIRQQELYEIKQSVYYYDYNQGQLYVFNHRDKYVQSIMISPLGIIQNDQFFCYQQDNQNNQFLVDQVAYINVCKKFIVLSKNNTIYAQSEKEQQFRILKCLQETKKGIKETEFTPSIEANEKYKQLLTCPSGKYFYLANYYCCDRYDQTGKRLQSIPISGQIKIFSDSSINLIQQKIFHKQQSDKKQLIGNPALDIVKGSFTKFGPNAQFLYKQKQKNIHLYIEPKGYNQIEQYFNNLNLNMVNLNNQEIKFSECDSNQIINIIFSRVPLQLCTIENGILIPLNDGFRQLSLVQRNITVDSKVKQLHLGFLEDYLQAEEKNIFVVGIIGKQSSGKSYLLNRVFGTRFSVSSARCTDGVWGSIAYVDNQKFLILDCEGLFNGARTEKDEIKMLAFVTAISDITILNSDSTFSRYQNELFNNLVEASKQLNDEKLFMGLLYIIIRDVSITDNKGVDQELLKNLDRLKSADSQDIIFLDKLFNNKLSVEKLVNNENSYFDEQLKKVRSYFLNNSMKTIRWKNGKELIQMVKIVLCQLELSDTTNASLIDFQIRLEQIYFESKAQWYKFSLNQPNCEDIQLIQGNYQFEIDDDDYIMENKVILKQLYDDLKLNDTINSHKLNLQEANNQLNKLMEQRKELIIQKTQSEISDINGLEVQTQIQKENSKLLDFFQIQINRYQFCQSKCNECYLTCKQFKNHIDYSSKLKGKLENEISILEELRNMSSIKDNKEEQVVRNSLICIAQNIEEIDNTLKELTNLIKWSQIQDQLQQLMNEVRKSHFFNVENLQNSEINQELEKQNIQITFDINYINYLQEDINKKQQNQVQKQNNNINEIKKIKEEYLKLQQSCQEIEKKIKEQKIIKKEKKKEIEKLNLENQKIISDKEEIKNQIHELKIIYDEKVRNEHQSQINEWNKKNNEFKNEITLCQSRYVEIQREMADFDKMSQSEFIQKFQSLQQKKKELDDQLNQTKQKKKDLNEKQVQINFINQELQEKIQEQQELQKKSKAKLSNKNKIEIEIENLKKQLLELDSHDIENLIKQCNQQEFELKNSIAADYFSNVDLYVQSFEIVMKDETFQKEIQEEIQHDQEDQINEVQSMNIKKYFLNLKSQECEDYQKEIIKLQEEIQNADQEIQKSQKIVDEQQKYLQLVNAKKEKKELLNNYQNQLKDLNNQLKLFSQESNNFKDKLHQTQKEQNNLKVKEQEIIKENQQIHESIHQMNKNLKELQILQQDLMQCNILEQQKQEHEQLLKDWDGKEDYKNHSLEDLQQEKQNMEQQRVNLLIQQKENINSLEIYNKVETDAGRFISLKQKLIELVKLNLNVHSCLREDHKCDQMCKVCPDKICDNKAGHDEKQEHLCSSNNHKCNIQCEITLCEQKCNLELNHSRQHNCTNDHPCAEQCQYCSKKCHKDRSIPHSNHECEELYCTANCILCERRCKEKHKHSQFCNTQCEKEHQHSVEQQNHLCGDQHECKEMCQEKGVCQIRYTQVEIMWQSKFSFVKYTPQGDEKKKCCRDIKSDKLKHEQIHSCMIETEKQFHFCDQKCPECNKICDLKYGHPGCHSSQVHINKENQIFTLKEGQEENIVIQDQNNSTLRQYQVGDKSTPETCDQSCKRRGKSHYHLIECKDQSQCLEKQVNIKAKHSKEKYAGFQHLNFDEVLCLDFWKLKGWAHPIPNEMDNIGQCNYYCPLCIKINGEYQFCSQDAWHTQDNKISSHQFPCTLTHKEKCIQGIKIAFVIDTTESMSTYINSCKNIIQSIIKKTKEHKTIDNIDVDMKFAIVSYKDHKVPYDQNEKAVDVCEFTSDNQAISFLDKLSATGGDDTPEAVLDGLYASSQLNWSGNYQNLLYLIGDAPPHGKKYHNFKDSYPDGCPCKIQQSQIFTHIKNAKIQFKIMKLNQNIEGMITLFKQDYPELIVITPQDKDDITFQNLIIGDLCEYLSHNEITYQMA